MATDGEQPSTRTGADSDTFDVLSAFVPRLAVELGRLPIPSWTSVDGSMLSADISGFTALSEKLAGKGKAGAEEITSLINTCFTALIESAYRYGGEVIKFGGDALLVLFRGDRHRRRSADAGLLMQRALHSSAAAKRANLTMTVGVAAGPFDVFLVGSGYRELLVTGPRATEVIRLEGEAGKGDTLVDPLIAEHLPDEMKVREEHGGWVIAGSTGDEPHGPRERDPGQVELSPYVPTAVVRQLAAFSDLGGEHRLVAVGFVMVTGLAEQLGRLGPDGVAEALGIIVDDVVAACDAYGVTMLHTDIAPDGLKLILCAGAPVSFGDTTDALLQTALAIAASTSPFVVRQGIQAGRVFAGFLGSPYRRTYTLMGDPVNTAARMLGKADDRDIVAVESVVEHTRTIFVTEPLDPFLVKGKSEPIIAHKVRSSSDEVRRDTAGTRLFGRRDELGILGGAIGELGEVVVLSGTAGVGKSRLLDAAWDMAEGLHIFQAACTPYGATSPYSVFRPLLRIGTGIDLYADPRTAGELLDKIVRQSAPSMRPWLPLLAVPFGAEVRSTPESDAVDPKFRRSRIHDVVTEFLDTTLDGPVFLVVEDLHWIDDASGELLNHLVRAAGSRSWAAVLTRRPSGAWSPPADVEHLRFLELEPLSDDDVRSLAIEISDRALSDTELDTIAARSGGNPLFAVELARALSRKAGGQLPDSIEGLIATRIDALPPEQRRLMRVAAVFGRDFDLDDVTAITSDAVDVGGELDDMIERERSDTYRFRHAMYRDVAYEGLPYEQRKRLHGDVARHLEAMSPEPEAEAGLLSLHFDAARMHAAAFRYASIAAADAAAAYAHHEAVEYYSRALTAGRYCSDVDARQRAGLLEQLGRSYEFSGQLAEADRVYTRLSRSTDDVAVRVDCLRRRARVRQKQNRLTAAVRLLGSAQKQLRRLGREEWVDRRLAEIHLNLAGVRMDQGQLDRARAEAKAAERHALCAGDRNLEVQAYGAIVGATTEWHEAAPYADKGFGPSAPPDAWEARYILGTNLGMAAYFAGRWGDAVDYYGRGRAAAEAMGNVTGAALASMNAAEILVDQGHLGPAVDALDEVSRVLAAAGYEAALLYAELLRATALSRLGDTERAIAALQRCEAEFRSGSMLLYALESLLRLAEATFADGSPDIAVELTRRALEEAPTVARSAVIEARAQRLLGLMSAVSGDLDTAQVHLDTAIGTCREGDLRFELALALAAKAAIVGDDAAALEAASIFDDLDVVPAGRPNAERAWLPGSGRMRKLTGI